MTIWFYIKSDKTDCSNYRGISLLPTTHKILSNILVLRLTPYTNLLGIISMDFNITVQIFCICRILEKNGSIMGQDISYL
jgi:hypothetical protein